MKHVAIQSDYAKLQQSDPTLLNLKHMLDQDTFFVFGQIIDGTHQYTHYPLAIAGFSDQYKKNERVDAMFNITPNTHYGLNLPAGRYQLLVMADLNRNNQFEHDEVIGQKQLEVTLKHIPNKVLGKMDIELNSPTSVVDFAAIEAPVTSDIEESIFYPAGSLRPLNDPFFSREMSTLGLYHPAAFLESSPNMFYALEEDLSYKIPVIFVHGINGSPREFFSLIENLDRNRYKPWFFYYPSGADLNQLATFFYNIFLSGDVIPHNKYLPMIIVAHSMGGIVIQEALNLTEKAPAPELLFISIASPFGGHPAAASGEENGLLVLPSWRDLNPASDFVQNLFRRPLPEKVKHLLIYAYGNNNTLKLGANNDGVVPLHSQLVTAAQLQSYKQIGFNAGHTEILTDPETVQYVIRQLQSVNTLLPPEHMEWFRKGGFKVERESDFSKTEKYFIEHFGYYIHALDKGILKPLDEEQTQFVSVLRHEQPATHPAEKAWLKYKKFYPDLPEIRE